MITGYRDDRDKTQSQESCYRLQIPLGMSGKKQRMKGS